MSTKYFRKSNRTRLIAEFKQRHEEARRAEETLHVRAEALRRAVVEGQGDDKTVLPYMQKSLLRR